jgi:hypothetical protein
VRNPTLLQIAQRSASSPETADEQHPEGTYARFLSWSASGGRRCGAVACRPGARRQHGQRRFQSHGFRWQRARHAGASVIGIGWNVNVTAFDPSWLSELVVGFGSSSANEVNLSVGIGDDLPGTATYSSAGIVDLVELGFNFNAGADGIVRLEFFEGFNDPEVNPDGIWNSGTLTIQVAAIPEPSTYAMMALGLLAVGGLARRKARG